MEVAARQPAPFYLRPMCVAAVGALFGTLLVRAVPPPNAYLAALLPLGAAAAAVAFQKRGWFLLFLFLGMALLNAAVCYPPGGIYPKSGPVVALPESPAHTALENLRTSVGSRILTLFPENGPVAKGMLLGDKAGIDDGTMEAFGNAGILHLMAVSGLHVSVLAGAFSLLLRRSAWVRLVLTGLFCLGYAALTAFSPSVVRASLMLLYLLAAVPLMRRADPITGLSVAFLAVVAVNPNALFSAGFQLSFSAVYGLMLLSPLLARPLARLGTTASGLIASSVAVTVATIPAMGLAFRELSFLSILTNLIVLPLAPVFLIPAFLATALSYASMPLANLVATPARLSLHAIVAVAEAGGRLALRVRAPGCAAYLLFLFAILLYSPLFRRSGEQRALCGTAALAASFACWLLF